MSPELQQTLRVGIDAGGTCTRLRAALPDGSTHVGQIGSVNPASVSEEAATDGWYRIMTIIRRLGSDSAGAASLWIGSAAISTGTLEAQARLVTRAAQAHAVRGQAVLSGDVPPLLYAPPLDGHGAVVVAGTGSCVLARNRDTGRSHLVGGAEYLVSDEGSGFDIGLQGLRAAVRAADGVGEPTPLVNDVSHVFSADAKEVGRRLATAARAKLQIAGFAGEVLRRWPTDPVSRTICETAATALGCSSCVAVRQVGLEGPVRLTMTGGIFAISPRYRAAVEAIVRRDGIDAQTELVSDAAAAALSLTACPTRVLDDMEPFPTALLRWDR